MGLSGRWEEEEEEERVEEEGVVVEEEEEEEEAAAGCDEEAPEGGTKEYSEELSASSLSITLRCALRMSETSGRTNSGRRCFCHGSHVRSHSPLSEAR